MCSTRTARETKPGRPPPGRQAGTRRSMLWLTSSVCPDSTLRMNRWCLDPSLSSRRTRSTIPLPSAISPRAVLLVEADDAAAVLERRRPGENIRGVFQDSVGKGQQERADRHPRLHRRPSVPTCKGWLWHGSWSLDRSRYWPCDAFHFACPSRIVAGRPTDAARDRSLLTGA